MNENPCMSEVVIHNYSFSTVLSASCWIFWCSLMNLTFQERKENEGGGDIFFRMCTIEQLKKNDAVKYILGFGIIAVLGWNDYGWRSKLL